MSGTADRHAAQGPGALVPWVIELARTAPALVGSHLPGSPLDPRTRERLCVLVAEAQGARAVVWVHGTWGRFLGEGIPPESEVVEAVADYARESTDRGRPAPTTALDAMVPGATVRAVRATVARSALASAVGRAVDDLGGRVVGRLPRRPRPALREASLSVFTPLLAPVAGVAAAMAVVDSLAPELPEVRVGVDGQANLLAQLLAEAAPAYLSNAVVRAFVVGSPVPVAVGVRAGRSAATFRFGRGSVAVEDGVSPDAWVVLEGDVELLVRAASGALVREMGSIRIRPT